MPPWPEFSWGCWCCQPGSARAPPTSGEQAVKPPPDSACLCETKGYEFYFFNLSSEPRDKTGCEQLTIQLYVLVELKILKWLLGSIPLIVFRLVKKVGVVLLLPKPHEADTPHSGPSLGRGEKESYSSLRRELLLNKRGKLLRSPPPT